MAFSSEGGEIYGEGLFGERGLFEEVGSPFMVERDLLGREGNGVVRSGRYSYSGRVSSARDYFRGSAFHGK